MHDTKSAQISQKQDEHNIYIYIYIYIYKLFKEIFFLKSVIFRILRILNGLLQTKRIKMYILTK